MWPPSCATLSLTIYKAAAEYAATRGIIIADTKFEFGIIDGKLTLIDECITPDSSRFWPAEGYEEGKAAELRQAVCPRLAPCQLGHDGRAPAPAR